ncbi:hypothetical protein niasHT_002839 [Heterodera trifolii]|uniref:RING-type domain-containing protein n=1 Tax=Heterodera trifolii TaxID=157864 RepID=A0ABD2LRK1_9BILA
MLRIALLISILALFGDCMDKEKRKAGGISINEPIGNEVKEKEVVAKSRKGKEKVSEKINIMDTTKHIAQMISCVKNPTSAEGHEGTSASPNATSFMQKQTSKGLASAEEHKELAKAKNAENSQTSAEDGATDGQSLAETIEKNENSNGQICSICKDEDNLLGTDPENTKMKELTNCHHRFHRECVDNWLQTQNNCPICRVRVNSNDLPPRTEQNRNQTRPSYVGLNHDQIRPTYVYRYVRPNGTVLTIHDDMEHVVEQTENGPVIRRQHRT